MSRCPITYELCAEGVYSPAGLRMLSPNLQRLNDLPYDARQQRREAVVRAGKMSIQGVQPKLSVRLNAKGGAFDVVDRGGRFVLKPQHEVYPNLPENEGVTMHLAKLAGIEVPVSGLVRSADGSWSYFVRRFDRVGHKGKVAVEDFAQLSGGRRDTKYDSSMEQVAHVIDTYCTFPAVEKVKLFKRSLFNFLVGNEDMHLKNFSLITRQGKVELAPAYDYLSTTVAYLALGESLEALEEVALPVQGKKRRLDRENWIDYYAEERLGLTSRVIDRVRDDLVRAAPVWRERINDSFVPSDQRKHYTGLLGKRFATLGW
ncbi:MAG: HipA domain-containing protein [Gammaproteobacteria bacterium]|nr:HipA domain-containing protein [Gammaproteobacteria bacterium]